jgi:hypothetical protein
VTARHRLLTRGTHQGYLIEYPSMTRHDAPGVTRLLSSIDDTVDGTRNPHPLWMERLEYLSVGTYSGEDLSFPGGHYYEWPFTNQGFQASHVSYGNPDPRYSQFQVDAYVTGVRAHTNPSRPEVSVPNLLYELKDIPEMLHLKGKEHAKSHPSNSAVEHNFGWNLLFQDLTRLLNFTAMVDKRVKEINGLYKNGGLHTGQKISDLVFQERRDGIELNSIPYITAYVLGTTHDHTWGSARWKPDSVDIPSAEELRSKIGFAIHGWDVSAGGLASTIWEALPWSWFVDYLGTVGDFLQGSRNAIGASATDLCIMRHIKTRWHSFPTAVTSGYTVKPGIFEFHDKVRQLGTPSPFAGSLAFLGTKQLVTLSSIAFNIARR